jgi:26S proteasome regulatory subunit N1
MLGRAHVMFEDDVDEELVELMRNTRLSEHFRQLGRDLEISEPKIPEDIYKSYLENINAGKLFLSLLSIRGICIQN